MEEEVIEGEVATETKEISTEEAKAALKKASEAKVSACGQAIAELLKQHDCDLVGYPQFTAQGTVTCAIRVVPK